MSTQKEIYSLIYKKGDGLHGKLHIIDFGKNGFLENREFMVYHADGFCFNVSVNNPDDTTDIRDIEDGFVFNVFSKYEGFQEIDDENILRVIKRSLNKY